MLKLENGFSWHDAHCSSLSPAILASRPLCSVWHMAHSVCRTFLPAAKIALCGADAGPPKVWQPTHALVRSFPPNAEASQATGWAPCPAWQALHPCLPVNSACSSVSSPASSTPMRKVSAKKSALLVRCVNAASAATTSPSMITEIRQRCRRIVLRGTQGGCVQPHVPSGSGPFSQGPPATWVRRHSQRPLLLWGVHSATPPQVPS